MLLLLLFMVYGDGMHETFVENSIAFTLIRIC